MSENLVEVKHLQQYFPAGGMGKNKQYVQAVDDVSCHPQGRDAGPGR